MEQYRRNRYSMHRWNNRDEIDTLCIDGRIEMEQIYSIHRWKNRDGIDTLCIDGTIEMQ